MAYDIKKDLLLFKPIATPIGLVIMMIFVQLHVMVYFLVHVYCQRLLRNKRLQHTPTLRRSIRLQQSPQPNSIGLECFSKNSVYRSLSLPQFGVTTLEHWLQLLILYQFHARTKHIEVDCHFIRQKILNKDITVKFICSQDHIVDVLTKGLSTSRFFELRNKLQVCLPPSSLQGGVSKRLSPLSRQQTYR